MVLGLNTAKLRQFQPSAHQRQTYMAYKLQTQRTHRRRKGEVVPEKMYTEFTQFITLVSCNCSGNLNFASSNRSFSSSASSFRVMSALRENKIQLIVTDSQHSVRNMLTYLLGSRKCFRYGSNSIDCRN